MDGLFVHITDFLKSLIDLWLFLNASINELVWGPPMLIILIGVGITVTIRTRFIQFSKFALMCRETMGNFFKRGQKAEGDVSPFQALTVAMGGTVGVGNIAGVATAIAIGGPGAIFWMWLLALFGMLTKTTEITLAVHYRDIDEQENVRGGPMYI